MEAIIQVRDIKLSDQLLIEGNLYSLVRVVRHEGNMMFLHFHQEIADRCTDHKCNDPKHCISMHVSDYTEILVTQNEE